MLLLVSHAGGPFFLHCEKYPALSMPWLSRCWGFRGLVIKISVWQWWSGHAALLPDNGGHSSSPGARHLRPGPAVTRNH